MKHFIARSPAEDESAAGLPPDPRNPPACPGGLRKLVAWCGAAVIAGAVFSRFGGTLGGLAGLAGFAGAVASVWAMHRSEAYFRPFLPALAAKLRLLKYLFAGSMIASTLMGIALGFALAGAVAAGSLEIDPEAGTDVMYDSLGSFLESHGTLIAAACLTALAQFGIMVFALVMWIAVMKRMFAK